MPDTAARTPVDLPVAEKVDDLEMMARRWVRRQAGEIEAALIRRAGELGMELGADRARELVRVVRARLETP